MQITIERLTEMILRAVLDELARCRIEVSNEVSEAKSPDGNALLLPKEQSWSMIDFTGYCTPVLTEDRIRTTEPGTTDITVPVGTYCTQGARELMRKRRIRLNFKNSS